MERVKRQTMSPPKAELRASYVLEDLGIEEPEDLLLLESIAWERGAIIRDGRLSGAEARLTMIEGKAIITISNRIRDYCRRRFSIAHELGHLELHRHGSGLVLCTETDIDNWSPQDEDATIEQEANAFAAALLLPERFFAPLCNQGDPSLELIAELADHFQVSLTATALRYVRFSREPCAVVYSYDGYVKWFRASKDFRDLNLFVNVRSPLHPSSLASLVRKKNLTRTVSERVEASAWLAPGQYPDDATVKEQSWGMPGYNAVITLLWADDVDDDDDWW
jgi:Zn-dependent peptidase ImmA (M78 family)